MIPTSIGWLLIAVLLGFLVAWGLGRAVKKGSREQTTMAVWAIFPVGWLAMLSDEPTTLAATLLGFITPGTGLAGGTDAGRRL